MSRKANILILLLTICFALTGCGDSSKEEGSEPSIPSYQVYLDIDFEGNLLFDKYDVDVCFDEEKLDTIPHGTYYTKMLESVDEGSHMILFHKNGDESVKGEYEVRVKCDTTFKCSIHAKGSEVKIDGVQTIDSIEGNAIQMIDTVGMNLEEAKESLTNLGFVNVTSEAKDDVIFVDSNWTVVSQNIDAGEKCDKNSEIVLTCEHNTDENPVAGDTEEEKKTDIANGDTTEETTEEATREEATKDVAVEETTADTAKEAVAVETTAAKAKEIAVEKTTANTAKEAAEEEAMADALEGATAEETKAETAKTDVADTVKADAQKGIRSNYDLAYKIENKEYAVYYMIDTDEHQICTFSTNDTSILKAPYTGDFDDRIDIAYDEENHEIIKNKERGNDESILITTVQDSSFEYANELRKTTVEEAEEALNKLTGNSDNEKVVAKKASTEMEPNSDSEKEKPETEKEDTEEQNETTEIPSMTTSDLEMDWKTDYGHVSSDMVILGNDEGVTVTIKAPGMGVSKDDLFYLYDDQIVNVSEKDSTDHNGNPSVELYITGLTEGSTEIWVVVKEEYDKLGDNASVLPISVKKLDSTEGRVVYYTPTGEKYHFSADCAGVNAGITTLHDATSLEMDPCGKCAH